MGKRYSSGLCLAVGMTALMAGGSAIAEGAGSYLAARHANIVSDFTEASRYYAKAMIAAYRVSAVHRGAEHREMAVKYCRAHQRADSVLS